MHVREVLGSPHCLSLISPLGKTFAFRDFHKGYCPAASVLVVSLCILDMEVILISLDELEMILYYFWKILDIIGILLICGRIRQ